MATDLSQHIADTLLIDTHEHLRKEPDWVEDGPDILQDLFGNYVPADLIAAGATPEDLQKLNDASDPDLGARFDGIRSAFAAIRFTGYGEAVRILAHEIYGMADFSGDELHKAQEKLSAWRQPGGRHVVAHCQIGRLDHVQTDGLLLALPARAISSVGEVGQVILVRLVVGRLLQRPNRRRGH